MKRDKKVGDSIQGDNDNNRGDGTEDIRLTLYQYQKHLSLSSNVFSRDVNRPVFRTLSDLYINSNASSLLEIRQNLVLKFNENNSNKKEYGEDYFPIATT